MRKEARRGKQTADERKIMKQNVKMAKVITMEIKLNGEHILKIVTTVDPSVTPEIAYHMYGLRGHIIKSEETNVMPLPFALAHSYNLQKKIGIIH